MKTPKIIWVDTNSTDVSEHWTSIGCRYIRADIVEDIKIMLDCIVDRSIRMKDLNCADAQEILNLLGEE